MDLHRASTAIFYSIYNTQPGLAGISLGNFLIKAVVQKLSTEFSEIKHFATLAPVPGFRKCVASMLAQGDEGFLRPKEIDALKEHFEGENGSLQLDEILTGDWCEKSKITDVVKPILQRLCAQYLLEERRGSRALDPVANFHLSNGARLERINWLADLSENGMSSSYGFMVNYYYKLSEIEKNHEEYVTRTHIVASRGVKALLK